MIGPMMREERWEDCWSLEARKMRANHRTMGNQYFTNTRNLDTVHSKPTSRA